MYKESAQYYDYIYSFKDYKQASSRLKDLIAIECPRAKTLLDVACGTGEHLKYLSQDFSCEGLDVSDELLALARAKCPDSNFHLADMADFSLEKRYDVITLLFSSIAYAKTPERLYQVVKRLACQVEIGGRIFIEPWFTPEMYWTNTITANTVNETDLKICWMYTSDVPCHGVATLRIHYLVGTPSGISRFEEVHELGLFSRLDWHKAFSMASLKYSFDESGLFNRGLYTAWHAGNKALRPSEPV